MPADTFAQLVSKIQVAFDSQSDVAIDPAVARAQQALLIATAIRDFTIGRVTVVTGSSVSGGPVTGTGTIQE